MLRMRGWLATVVIQAGYSGYAVQVSFLALLPGYAMLAGDIAMQSSYAPYVVHAGYAQ
jgi:hypothetical protein